ncbi:MAG: UDP-N-acetylmuramoyl-tripeptide--D-alanyl-D-alanine ligase [Desulfomonilaceae bacterium]|nr:UDP-N-acetylmuramoyl-tripeptide--D-alanyl-D-alanine ligase [Desulfomonilaceae bacterium]
MRAAGGPFPAKDIVKACRGVLLRGNGECVFPAITTDSRDVRKGDLFVPLKGLNFDGHDFLIPALEAGARGSLATRDVNREIPSNLANIVLVQVQDTLQALSDLASAHRDTFSIPLIAVTGSSGKTTVKEMIAAVLRRSHHPLVSQANFNNLIGLPMTVLNLSLEHTVAVVEAGINTVGEMDELSRAASPDVAVITNIGPVHLEGLGSIENVAREKFKLVRSLSSTGSAVVPAYDPYVEPLVSEWGGRFVTFGVDRGDYRAEDVRLGAETFFELVCPHGRREIRIKIQGRHNVANALAAAAAAMAVGATLDDVREGLADFLPPDSRMEIVPLPGNRTLIRDCYNANPQSVTAALEVLAGSGASERSLAVLGDMAELGPRSRELHEYIGGRAAVLGISRLVFVGRYGRFFMDGFTSAGGHPERLTVVPDKETAWDVVRLLAGEYGIILVKGSRAMKMELIADRIVGEN